MTNLLAYYLEELLKPYGEVKSSSKISGEIKEIDVLFTPSVQQNSNLEVLGLLVRFAEFPAILEPLRVRQSLMGETPQDRAGSPFRNAASGDEICDCIQKLLEVKALLRRDAKANKTRLQESEVDTQEGYETR